jgi:F1F0 ATPase subunit 2
MTVDYQAVGVGLLAGLVLGAFFFGGLMLTVRRLPTASRPTALALSSFVVRAAVVVAGLAWLAQGDWRRLAGALIGLVVMRVVLVRAWGLRPAGGGSG